MIFFSAAKPSDLGTLGFFFIIFFLLLLLVVVVDHFWNLPMCRFSEVCSKVARFFNSIS